MFRLFLNNPDHSNTAIGAWGMGHIHHTALLTIANDDDPIILIDADVFLMMKN